MKIVLYFFLILPFFWNLGCSNSSNHYSGVEFQSDTTKTEQNKEKKDKKDKKDKKLKISSKLTITKHAKCRMDCRKIDLDEIKEVISKGQVNPKKSELKNKPCPVLALEGLSSKTKRKMRVVLAACENETKIVTVINLDQKSDDPSCKKCE